MPLLFIPYLITAKTGKKVLNSAINYSTQ